MAKGDRPWLIGDMKWNLSKLWGLHNWKLIPIGKGYFHLLFHNQDEMNAVRQRGNVQLRPGVFRISEWDMDFNPFIHKQTTAQVWLKLHGISWYYWHPKILWDIASCVGFPIKMDGTTLNGEYGFYARILVEVDMATNLPDQVTLMAHGKKILVKIEYERLPPFCKFCRVVGHHVGDCRVVHHQIKRTSDMGKNSRKGHSTAREAIPNVGAQPDVNTG